MDSDEVDKIPPLRLGDVVRESVLIVPPDREPWVGIVVYVERASYRLHSILDNPEDLVGIQWFQAGYVEHLPASVVVLVQRATPDEKKP